jgi:hypothetical protein
VTIGISGQVIAATYNYQAPLTGATIVLADVDWYVLIDPAGAILALTVQMNPNPYDGVVVSLVFSQAVTNLTLSPNAGQSVKNNPATVAAGKAINAIYRLANTTWYFTS